MATTFEWLGQGNTGGDWMDSNGIYFGGRILVGSSNGISNPIVPGNTGFMANSETSITPIGVLVMPENFWNTSSTFTGGSASRPVAGFIFPPIINSFNRGMQ